MIKKPQEIIEEIYDYFESDICLSYLTRHTPQIYMLIPSDDDSPETFHAESKDNSLPYTLDINASLSGILFTIIINKKINKPERLINILNTIDGMDTIRDTINLIYDNNELEGFSFILPNIVTELGTLWTDSAIGQIGELLNLIEFVCITENEFDIEENYKDLSKDINKISNLDSILSHTPTIRENNDYISYEWKLGHRESNTFIHIAVICTQNNFHTTVNLIGNSTSQEGLTTAAEAGYKYATINCPDYEQEKELVNIADSSIDYDMFWNDNSCGIMMTSSSYEYFEIIMKYTLTSMIYAMLVINH